MNTEQRDELSAVILAAGPGSRIRDMTRSTPKCLLPIGNKPMIIHPLDKLVQAGFREATVIVSKNEAAEIENKLSEYGLNIKLIYAPVILSQDDHIGTLDSLRLVYQNIHSDTIIISCDTLGDYDLVPFINEFRRKSPSLLTMLCQGNLASMTRCYGSKRGLEKDIIALAKDNRIVLFNSESDFASNVELTPEQLTDCPETTIHGNLLDGHVYLIKKSALDHFMKKEDIYSLKGEVVPSLVQMQFIKSPGNIRHHDLFEDECFKFEPLSGQFRGLLLMKNSCEEVSNRSVTCYAFIHPGYLLRANTLMGYMEANKKIVVDATETSGDHENVRKYLIDETSQLSHGSTIIKSVIGANCKIGSKVKITESVIMDHVTIEDGSVITNSVICSKATVGRKCDVNLCLIASGFNLTAGESVVGELLGEEGHDVDIEDL